MFRQGPLLYPTDFSYYSYFALKYAVALARRYGARIHVLHAVDMNALRPWGCPNYWMWPENLLEVEACLCERASGRLECLLDGIRKQGIEVEHHVSRGAPTAEIVRMAQWLECGLVIMGTHGRLGLEHAVFGSVAEEVARVSPAPVLTIKHPEHEFLEFQREELQLRRVFFPTDFSRFSLATLPYAVSLCREFDATLYLAHVVNSPIYAGEFLSDAALATLEDMDAREREELEEVAGRWPDVRIETVQRVGTPAYELLQALRDCDADLAVLPTHGRGGVVRRVFGGVAEKVYRLARCPVLTVRPEMTEVRELAEADAGSTGLAPPAGD